MGKIVVTEFVSLDGVIEDPGGAEDYKYGGWTFEIDRGEGDKFMNKYFLPRRTAYSTIMSDLNDLANQSKVTPKESSNIIEEVEGSDTLQRMQVTANFEATFDNLIHFVNLLDKSNRLMIIESLNATPQQDGKRLNVLLKLDTFVREDGSPQ